MADAPQPPREVAPAPSLKVRLAWWFGIYSAGMVIWGIPWACTLGIPTIFGAPFVLLAFFPCGLAYFFDLLWKTGASIYLFVLAYFIYGYHLSLTFRASTRRKFWLFLISLIVIICANLVGCYSVYDSND